jgi:hypothetical protein
MQILLTLIIHFCSSFLMNLCLCSRYRCSTKRERFSGTASVKHLCCGCLLPTSTDQAACIHVAWWRGVSTTRGRSHTMLLSRTFSESPEAALRAWGGVLLKICCYLVGIQSVDWALECITKTILTGFGVADSWGTLVILICRRKWTFVFQWGVRRSHQSCSFVRHRWGELLGWAARHTVSCGLSVMATHAAYDRGSLTRKDLLVITVFTTFIWKHSWSWLLFGRCAASWRMSFRITT